jgi:hypothetical protein
MPDPNLTSSPLWLKLVCTISVCILVPVNWRQYGPANFLWFSDLAAFMTVAALWADNRLLASMAALAVLLPEIAWSLDYLFRLATGKQGIGLANYMFDKRIPRWIRSVSLFHLWLPPVLVWLQYRLGYDSRAFLWQTLVAAIVIPLSYVFGTEEQNVNWVYGLGDKPQRKISPRLFVFLMVLAFPIVIYTPTHFLLLRLFPYPAHWSGG